MAKIKISWENFTGRLFDVEFERSISKRDLKEEEIKRFREKFTGNVEALKSKNKEDK